MTRPGARDLPGLDLDRLAGWLPSVLPGAGAGLRAELVAGGKSNLTYLLSDGTQTWILRRPPLGHVLATAHDMHREYRVMSALQDTEVPVPRMVAFCADPELLGAPFYVMERCIGTPYRRAAELTPLGPARTRRIADGLIDILARLHAVDPAAVGLADFGRPDGFLARQVERWRRQLEASRSRELPAAGALHDALAVDVPAPSPTGIVHGDYRLDNVLVNADDEPVAVIDWEMATLGDPLTDLALMVVYQRLGGLLGAIGLDAADAPGYPAEADVVARYAAGSDRDLGRFGWYLGLASYKLAGILEGIHLRHSRGQTVGGGFAGVGDAVAPLLDAGLQSLRENG
ncbi:phosphotransferase family protein [Nakamurella sp.]|uniref:phosphotransferase family protein n=1 Tax=Nakamurella sp. TaxID=1869182 RepID=UPI003782FBFC